MSYLHRLLSPNSGNTSILSYHFYSEYYLIYIMKNCTGDIFPVAFARSLVAISNHKDDNLRRVCIETLRELAVENPRVVATVNGFTTLLDIVLEPSSQDMAEPILMSLLFLLNDPKSRYVFCSVPIRTDCSFLFLRFYQNILFFFSEVPIRILLYFVFK